MRFNSCSGMPTPRSRTRSTNRSSSGASNSTEMCTPSGEYLTALSSRFETAVRNSSGSPSMRAPLRGPQLLRIAQHARAAAVLRRQGWSLAVIEIRGLQMMAHSRQFHALAYQRIELHWQALRRAFLLRRLTRFQHLFHGAQQAIGIEQHELVELPALRFFHLASLQGFEVEPDGGDGRLQFMGDQIGRAHV